MKKFKVVPNGFDQEQVIKFVDNIIKQIELFSSELKNKDEKIEKLSEKLDVYQNMNDTLSNAILAAQQAAEKMKEMARKESIVLIEEARRNADQIVNDAILRAQQVEYQTNIMKKNLVVYKNRIKNILESQIEISEDLDKFEF